MKQDDTIKKTTVTERAGITGKAGVPGRVGAPDGVGVPGRVGAPGRVGVPGRAGAPGKVGAPGRAGAPGKAGAPDSAEPLIKLDNIYKIYEMGDEEVHANDGINLSINKGEFVSIVGKSGCGKSTLMNIIGALDVPSSGNYYLGGVDTSEMSDDELAEIRNKMIGFIFQQYNLLPKLSIRENVELPLLYQGIPEPERSRRVMEQLDRVGLKAKADNLPKQLSGGQQQRVSIARALAAKPQLILADEPTGALDSKTSREVLSFLKQLNDEGNTVVMITHDPGIAKSAKRVVELSDGKIIFDGDVKDYAAKL